VVSNGVIIADILRKPKEKTALVAIASCTFAIV
jgi:hypothetical protein